MPGQIIGAVLWILGLVVFWVGYIDDFARQIGFATTMESKVGLLVLFAGVWGIVLSVALRILVPSRFRARLE